MSISKFAVTVLLLFAASENLSAQVEAQVIVDKASARTVGPAPLAETAKPAPKLLFIEGVFNPVPLRAKHENQAYDSVALGEQSSGATTGFSQVTPTLTQSTANFPVSNATEIPIANSNSIVYSNVYSNVASQLGTVGGIDMGGFNPNVGYVGPGDMRTHLWNDHSADLLRNGIDEAALMSMPMPRVQKWHNFFHGTEGLPGTKATSQTPSVQTPDVQPITIFPTMDSTFPIQTEFNSVPYDTGMITSLGTIIQTPIIQTPIIQPIQQSIPIKQQIGIGQSTIVEQTYIGQ